MTTAMHGIPAAADKTARKIDRDEVLVMTVHRGEVYLSPVTANGPGRRTSAEPSRAPGEREGDVRPLLRRRFGRVTCRNLKTK